MTQCRSNGSKELTRNTWAERPKTWPIFLDYHGECHGFSPPPCGDPKRGACGKRSFGMAFYGCRRDPKPVRNLFVAQLVREQFQNFDFSLGQGLIQRQRLMAALVEPGMQSLATHHVPGDGGVVQFRTNNRNRWFSFSLEANVVAHCSQWHC
jgi:hypothetical protein